MKSLAEQLQSYATYHHDSRNKLTHFFGVPLVIFSLFVFLGWFRFVHTPEIPFATGASIFYLAVFVYYLCLDWKLALVQAPLTLAILWLADRVSLLPFSESLLAFLATMIIGWSIQLLGHFFEGKRPALLDNLLQIFNAPLFLTVEILLLLGWRKDLRDPGRFQQPPGFS
jgi:uncharacterized membrane protein YGL010W